MNNNDNGPGNSEIEITDLYPGEFALDGQKIAKFLTALEAGEILPPISVYKMSERHIASDGNNRVTAWIKFNQKQKQAIPPMRAIIVVKTLEELSRHHRQRLECIANKFGKGPEAFLGMRASDGTPGNSFFEVWTEEASRITNA